MNRRDLQSLAESRLREADVLLAAREYNGAYYLAGYSVECAIKACIAKQTMAEDFPDVNHAKASWVHDLEALIKQAGLLQTLSKHRANNTVFHTHWLVAKDWSVDSRYDLSHTMQEAEDLVRAIADPHSGILAWLRLHW
jgi:HEPN domain-containing protein